MNKPKRTFLFAFLIIGFFFSFHNLVFGQEPWREEQLMEPSVLAAIIQNNSEAAPLLISVNPEGMYGLDAGEGIKGAETFGAAEEPENLDKLKARLKAIPKEKPIVLYCGCCPMDMCPNIRPAFRLLNEMGFTNHQLLKLEKNIRVDWINKGYPMNE